MLFFRRKKIIIGILCLYLLLTVGTSLPAQGDLEYKVSVDAMLVPLFAVDAKGNPVDDLKKDELVLKVNGKIINIHSFRSYRFEHEGKVTETVTVKKTTPAARAKFPDRMVFIIIDSLYTGSDGLRRSKEIASDLVRGAPGGDQFVLLANTPGGGLKHLAGPDSGRNVVLEKIDKIVTQRSIWRDDLFTDNTLPRVDEPPKTKVAEAGDMDATLKDIEKDEYTQKIRQFSGVLSRLKFALKTITKPKIVFLFSEGFARGAYEKKINPNDPSSGVRIIHDPLERLMRIAKAVNQGGSVLYTINPESITKSVDREASGEMSLRYLADESGGKYFSGSDTVQMIQLIRKTTAAYYELGFLIPPQTGEQMKLDITCTRKNVRVHTLNHSERNKPYHMMEPVQKKIFALSVTVGGGWSSMSAKVSRAKYKPLKKDKKRRTITVHLPAAMRNRELDVFVCHRDPETQDVEVDYQTRKPAARLELELRFKKGKDLYFTVIEPRTSQCITNKIK